MLIVLTLGWCRACQCHTLCLWLQQISICKQKSGDFKANKHENNLIFYNWNKRVLKRDRMVTDPTCSDTQKGEKTQSNWNINWEIHHLPMSGILIVKPGRKKSLNTSIIDVKRKRLLLNACFTVRPLRLESARLESDNFHTFSLVAKAHMTIKRKIRMCWTHRFLWELVETKWRTNPEDCS